MAPINNQISNILLVDDDADELELFQDALDQLDSTVSTFHTDNCNDPKLKALPKIDLVFLDINMPNLDGFGWLRCIREKVSQRIPVIMYSTTKNAAKVNFAYELGADLFITKPDSRDKLVKVLDEVLQLDWSHPQQLARERMAKGQFHISY